MTKTLWQAELNPRVVRCAFGNVYYHVCPGPIEDGLVILEKLAM